MRLRNIVVAAAVTAGSLTGAGLAATPAGAAASANPAITIRAIDREGKQVAVTASLQSPVISPAGIDETLTSAHPARVPKGTYNIAAWVAEPGGGAQTLVDRELVVRGPQTVVFDARKGRQVRFTVKDRTVRLDALEAEPFAPKGWAAFDGYGGIYGQRVYIVPGTMAPGYHLALEANLSRPQSGGSVSPVDYLLVRVLGRTIGSNLTFTASTSALASDRVTVRRIDPNATGTVWFSPSSSAGSQTFGGTLPATPFGQTGRTPFTVKFHFTPGYAWEAQTTSGTDVANGLPVLRGGHSYSQTFDRAAFGPSDFGVTLGSNPLQPVPTPFGDDLLVDTSQGLGNIGFGLNAATVEAWVYRGSKLVAHVKNNSNGFSVPNSATPHWYTVRVRVTRGAGARLFTAETVSYHFQSWTGQPSSVWDSFWPRIVPVLNWMNAARHGTKTMVPVWFSDQLGNIAAHGVRMWASANGGKTWYPLRVSRSGYRWSATVTNPAKPGYVSLRVQGTNLDGYTASVTMLRAYAVS